MNRVYISLLAVALTTASFAEEEPDEYRDFPMSFTETIEDKDTKIDIHLKMRKFDWTKNKVEYESDGVWKPATPESPYPFRVNGKQALGTDMGVPGHELETFSITWGGKKIELPEALWRDCFHLFMWSEDQLNDPENEGRWGTTYARLSDSGKTLLIVSYGGGGAGSYKVTWIIPREGQPDRIIENLNS
jgi:hypothetical protein